VNRAPISPTVVGLSDLIFFHCTLIQYLYWNGRQVLSLSTLDSEHL